MEFRNVEGPSILSGTAVAGDNIEFSQVPGEPFVLIKATGIGDLGDHISQPNPHPQYLLQSAVEAALDSLNVAFYDDATKPFTGEITGPFSPGVRLGLFAGTGAVRFDAVLGDGWTIYAFGLDLYIESDSGVSFVISGDGNFTFAGGLQGNFISGVQYELDGSPWLDSVDKVIGGGVTIPASSVTNSRVTKNTNYTITNSDQIIDVDATAVVQITLPSAIGRNGREFRVTKVAGANNVTVVATGGQTINGAANKVIAGLWDSWVFYSNGANWIAV